MRRQPYRKSDEPGFWGAVILMLISLALLLLGEM